jgi:hypothetical protein
MTDVSALAEVQPRAAGTDLAPLSRGRYVIAVLLPLVAIMAVIGWYLDAWSMEEQKYLNMPQQSLPAVLTAGHPGMFFVYAEGSTTITDVRVTDDAGTDIPVTMKSVSIENYGGLSPKQVARFTVQPRAIPQGPVPVPPPRTARVEITGSGVVRVGEFTGTDFLRWERWGMAALLLINVGSSIAIVVVPIVQRRRRRAAR